MEEKIIKLKSFEASSTKETKIVLLHEELNQEVIFTLTNSIANVIEDFTLAPILNEYEVLKNAILNFDDIVPTYLLASEGYQMADNIKGDFGREEMYAIVKSRITGTFDAWIKKQRQLLTIEKIEVDNDKNTLKITYYRHAELTTNSNQGEMFEEDKPIYRTKISSKRIITFNLFDEQGKAFFTPIYPQINIALKKIEIFLLELYHIHIKQLNEV